MTGTITVSELAECGKNIGTQLVDVRSATEFRAGHIPGAVNIPMDEIESRVPDLAASRSIVLVCQSGQRARMTAGLLAPCRKDVVVLEGGTKAWRDAEMPVVVSNRFRWSLERQVRLGAGLIVLLGVLLALAVDRLWVGLSAFAGFGLCFAGLTDICPMGIAFSRMPWNATTRCQVRDAGSDEAQCC
jgi:rhodanese-related sulfurtransferase